MNRIEDKSMVPDAARYIKEEIRENIPGVSREKLCEMVDDFIYYQSTDVSRDEAHKVVEETCLLKKET